VKSALLWVGGKSAEADYLASLLPPHSCYVEVFGGAGSVLLSKRPSQVEVYNDLNGELVNFFRVVRDAPEAFKETWRYALVSREEFYRLRDVDLSTLDPVQRAHRFMYINRACFGGKMKATSSFGISARNRSSLTAWLIDLEDNTDALHERLRSVYIENLPCLELIERWDKSKPGGDGTVFFCDPPYVDTSGYSVGKFTQDNHKRLSEALGSIAGRFLLTVNEHPLIRSLYDGCFMVERSKQYSIGRSDAGGKEYAELIISNYPLPNQKQSTFLL
jgi:DNA adenine methylase